MDYIFETITFRTSSFSRRKIREIEYQCESYHTIGIFAVESLPRNSNYPLLKEIPVGYRESFLRIRGSFDSYLRNSRFLTLRVPAVVWPRRNGKKGGKKSDCRFSFAENVATHASRDQNFRSSALRERRGLCNRNETERERRVHAERMTNSEEEGGTERVRRGCRRG